MNNEGNNKNLKKVLKITIYVILIILISLISFVGVYVKDKNKYVNKLPSYTLGTDIDQNRNIVIKVDTSTSSKTYDENGTEVNSTDNTVTNTTTQDVPVNDDSVLTEQNYEEVKKIIEQRLKYMNCDYYEIKCNKTDGTISIDVPENTDTDYIAQYCITKGVFLISDNDTGDVLIQNSDVKDASVKYNTTTSGTSVYLNIDFTKEGKEKLKDISSTYVQSTDDSGNTTTKKIKMTLDNQTIMTTYFSETLSDGVLQVTLGTSSDSSTIQSYAKQASNIAVFLNSNPMPITYTSSVNRIVYSDITLKTLITIIIVLSSIFAVLLIYMILSYKKLGLLGAITSVGFIAILLIIIRYANVEVTLTGIFAIMISAIMEYLFLMHIFDVYYEDTDIETNNKETKNALYKELEKLIPVFIIAIVFSLVKWELAYSVGMILFWAMLEMYLYNIFVLRIICPKKQLMKEEMK